jgi:hypothetical protein
LLGAGVAFGRLGFHQNLVGAELDGLPCGL